MSVSAWASPIGSILLRGCLVTVVLVGGCGKNSPTSEESGGSVQSIEEFTVDTAIAIPPAPVDPRAVPLEKLWSVDSQLPAPSNEDLATLVRPAQFFKGPGGERLALLLTDVDPRTDQVGPKSVAVVDYGKHRLLWHSGNPRADYGNDFESCNAPSGTDVYCKSVDGVVYRLNVRTGELMTDRTVDEGWDRPMPDLSWEGIESSEVVEDANPPLDPVGGWAPVDREFMVPTGYVTGPGGVRVKLPQNTWIHQMWVDPRDTKHVFALGKEFDFSVPTDGNCNRQNLIILDLSNRKIVWRGERIDTCEGIWGTVGGNHLVGSRKEPKDIEVFDLSTKAWTAALDIPGAQAEEARDLGLDLIAVGKDSAFVDINGRPVVLSLGTGRPTWTTSQDPSASTTRLFKPDQFREMSRSPSGTLTITYWGWTKNTSQAVPTAGSAS